MKKGIIFHSSLLSLLLMCIINVYGQHYRSEPRGSNFHSIYSENNIIPCQICAPDSCATKDNLEFISVNEDSLLQLDTLNSARIVNLCYTCHNRGFEDSFNQKLCFYVSKNNIRNKNVRDKNLCNYFIKTADVAITVKERDLASNSGSKKTTDFLGKRR